MYEIPWRTSKTNYLSIENPRSSSETCQKQPETSLIITKKKKKIIVSDVKCSSWLSHREEIAPERETALIFLLNNLKTSIRRKRRAKNNKAIKLIDKASNFFLNFSIKEQ